MMRKVWFSAILALLAVSVYGQDRTVWRTAADIREGSSGGLSGTVIDVDDARRQLVVTPDDDRTGQVTIITDSVSTQYTGFGGVINDAPEIFTGSSGFANVRVGDRIDVRGNGRSGARIAAAHISLLGRSAPASQTGVGGTRSPTSVSTPTATSTATASGGFAEGTIRQLNANTGLIVIETAPPYRRMITIRASQTTPVYYRGEIYRIGNLEVGDQIRAEADAATAAADDITARAIDVIASVDEGRTDSGDRRITTLTGRVTRVTAGTDMIRLDTGRSTVDVDMRRAEDSEGRRVRAADVRVGDEIDVTGSYAGNSDVFGATTIRVAGSASGPIDDDEDGDAPDSTDLVTVSIAGTVVETLETSPTLVIRDRTTGREVHVFVTSDFVYRTSTGTYSQAERLAVNTQVLIKAFRDEEGNLIAQTIRVR